MLLMACVALGALNIFAAASQASAADSSDAVAAVEGLWAYTKLTTSSGAEMPLTGVILYKDGKFAQQSIFNGEPFEQQGVMAHAGTYAAGPRGVHMVAEQTISISPQEQPSLTFRRDTQHDIAVERSADRMTLTFASGTVQEFARIGPASGELYRLKQGLLALVDGHFVLVSGDESAVVSGFGTFERDGSDYIMHVTRWGEAKGDTTLNRKDVTIKATFDGQSLTLEDGRSFNVAQGQ
jgi:hypothetical protein